jgi:ribosomal protein S18 acetylase RimI-like enzyme
MTFAVRTPAPTEAESIAEMHVAIWQEAYSHLLPAGFFDKAHARMRREMWERILSTPRPDWTVRVAEVDRRIVGLALSGPSVGAEGEEPPRARQLFNLYTREAVYGTGVGQALLEAVLGREPAMLWVAKENPRAIAFYRRNGFEFDGLEQIDPLAPGITDARMVR